MRCSCLTTCDDSSIHQTTSISACNLIRYWRLKQAFAPAPPQESFFQPQPLLSSPHQRTLPTRFLHDVLQLTRSVPGVRNRQIRLCPWSDRISIDLDLVIEVRRAGRKKRSLKKLADVARFPSSELPPLNKSTRCPVRSTFPEHPRDFDLRTDVYRAW